MTTYPKDPRYADDYEPDGVAKPTNHPPGSFGRIEVYRKRWQNEEPITTDIDKPDMSGIEGGYLCRLDDYRQRPKQSGIREINTGEINRDRN